MGPMDFNLYSTYHGLSGQDAQTVAVIRAQTAAFKGATFGPQGRAPYDEIMNAVPPAAGVSHQAAAVGRVNGVWCHPPRAHAKACILFLHGGGYVMGSAKAYRHFAGHFAQRTGLPAFVADYRLGPEHPFPAALEDAVSAYHGLVDEGFEQVFVVGDSAGGGLTLSLMAALRDEPAGRPLPRAAAVMSPWTDLTLSGDSMRKKAEEELYLSEAMMRACAAMYLGNAPATDPRASVLWASPKALPPLQVHVGTCEVALDDAVRYAKRAHGEGVDIKLHVWEGMPHVFQNCVNALEAAQRSLAMMAEHIRAHLAA